MKKLTRSTANAQVAGVCAGIAEYFNLDPTLVRAGFVIFTFLGAGSPILLYAILAFIIPEEA